MKPITLTVGVQVSAKHVVQSVEATDLGYIFAELANHFAGGIGGLFNPDTPALGVERRKAVKEFHSQLGEPAKRMLAEVMAYEFTLSGGDSPKNEVSHTGTETSAATEGQAA